MILLLYSGFHMTLGLWVPQFPWLLTGVLVLLYLAGTTLNVQSLMGVVMMVGIVVSNSILIVEFTHRLRESGEPPLKNGLRGISGILQAAQRDGIEWVFVDTPPLMSPAAMTCSSTVSAGRPDYSTRLAASHFSPPRQGTLRGRRAFGALNGGRQGRCARR